MLPIAILLPHAGLALPPEIAGRVALTAEDVYNEADIFADLIYDFRGQVAHWLAFPFARAVVDVNRADNNNHKHPGDGIVKTETSYGVRVYPPGAEPPPRLERHIIDRYWRPWHQQLAAIAADPSIKLVIDCHSMAGRAPNNYAGAGELRPRACVANLGDGRGGRDERGEHSERRPHRRLTAPAVLAAGFADRLGQLLHSLPALAPTGPDALLNDPFPGGWNLMAHGRRRQPWLMVEISRALYIGEQSSRSPTRPADREVINGLRRALWDAIMIAMQQIEK